MSDAIVVTDVVKRYGDFAAVDGVNLRVPQGSIYGLLGPNGAGKTTAIRMMMQIILPDEGSIEVLGQPVERLQNERIGYLPEERGLYKKMQILDMLTFLGQIKKLSRSVARERASRWLERMGLADYARKTAEDLSKGMQQKVQFIVTMIHEPEVVILDEPFSGLDPVNANILKDIILEYHDQGHTIIFSTHMMEQVERLCEEICLINKGRVVLAGTLASVKQEFGHGGVTLRFSGDGAFLADLPGVANFNDYGNEVFLRLTDGSDPARILEAARERLTITKYEVAEPSIHDIFIERVSATS